MSMTVQLSRQSIMPSMSQPLKLSSSPSDMVLIKPSVWTTSMESLSSQITSMLLRESSIHHCTPIKFIHHLFPANLGNSSLKIEIIPLNFGTVQVIANEHSMIQLTKRQRNSILFPTSHASLHGTSVGKINVIQFSIVERWFYKLWTARANIS